MKLLLGVSFLALTACAPLRPVAEIAPPYTISSDYDACDFRGACANCIVESSDGSVRLESACWRPGGWQK